MYSGLSQHPEKRLQRVLCAPDISIQEAISALDRAGTGILLLCDESRKLIGTLTDGDIRRALLHGSSLNLPSKSIATLNPITGRLPLTRIQVLNLMDHAKDFVVNHLPLIDEKGRVVELLLRADLISEDEFPGAAVIMAGGAGTRLRPLTNDLPKPLLPVGDRPLMELIIEQLVRSGIRRVHVTTHYKAEKIVEHFGNGDAFGVALTYVTEDRPLGTAGGLGMVSPDGEPLLVINGDILTRIDFRAMLEFHRFHQAALTMAVRPYQLQIPYGVVRSEGPFVRQLEEKPQLNFLTNAGIYLLEPNVQGLIPSGQRFDMTELIELLLSKEQLVVSFPIIEYWLDIGQHDDYAQAQEDLKRGVFS